MTLTTKDGQIWSITDRGPRMNFTLITNHYGAYRAEKIERGEAINRLVDRGVALDRASVLIEALPAGLSIAYNEADGNKSQIRRDG